MRLILESLWYVEYWLIASTMESLQVEFIPHVNPRIKYTTCSDRLYGVRLNIHGCLMLHRRILPYLILMKQSWIVHVFLIIASHMHITFYIFVLKILSWARVDDSMSSGSVKEHFDDIGTILPDAWPFLFTARPSNLMKIEMIAFPKVCRLLKINCSCSSCSNPRFTDVDTNMPCRSKLFEHTSAGPKNHFLQTTKLNSKALSLAYYPQVYTRCSVWHCGTSLPLPSPVPAS